MARQSETRNIDDETTAFYIYLKARLGERRDLSPREISSLYREYLIDREEARGVVASRRYVSLSEAARIAGVPLRTIRDWIEAGIVPEVRTVGRRGEVRIPADFMDRLELGIRGNPEFADSAAYVRAVRDRHEQMSDAEFFEWLDREEAALE